VRRENYPPSEQRQAWSIDQWLVWRAVKDKDRRKALEAAMNRLFHRQTRSRPTTTVVRHGQNYKIVEQQARGKETDVSPSQSEPYCNEIAANMEKGRGASQAQIKKRPEKASALGVEPSLKKTTTELP